MMNTPTRHLPGTIAQREIDLIGGGQVTVYYDPPIELRKETLIMFSDDGRVGIYDDDGNLIRTVESSRTEPGVQA